MAKIVKPDLTYQWASAAGGGSVAPSSAKIQTGHIVEKPNYEYMNWLQNRQDTSIAYTFQMGVPEWDSLVEYQYHANYKSYVQRNGLVYKALQVGTNKDPATEAAYWALAFDNSGSAATVQTNLNTHISNYNAQAVRLVANGIDADLGTTNVVTNLDTSIGIGEGYYDSGTTGTKPSSFGLVKKWRVSSTFVYQLAQTFEGKLAGRNSDNSGSTWTAWRITANELGDSTKLFLVANGTTGFEAVNKSQLDTKAPTAGNAAQEFAVATATTGNSAINKTQFDAKTSQATETVAGIAEICTDAELLAGSSDTVVATPLKLRLGFDVSIGTRGYVAFPTWLGGVVIQWGKETTVTASTVINLPYAGMANCYAVVATADQVAAGVDVEYVGVSSVSATNFTANTCVFPTAGGGVVGGGLPFWWIAIGK